MYIIYLPTGKKFEELPNPFYLCTIDPGSANFGFRIEKRYKRKNKVTINMEVMELLDFSEEEYSGTIINVMNGFEDMLYILKKVSIFVIEEQMSKQNPKMSILSTVLLTFLMCRLDKSSLNPVIYMIHPQAVKQYLGISGKKVPKKDKKKYVNEYSIFLLKKGEDKKGLKKLLSYKKADQFHLTDSTAQADIILDLEGYPCVCNQEEALDFINSIKGKF
jgi:hypothetical protein